MGAGAQIRELLTNLPVDDTWVLIGMGVLALAALSFMHSKWREARSGLGGGDKNANVHPAVRYFDAWQTAVESAGLRTEPSDGELAAPRAQGRLRGLRANLEMKLERSGWGAPDPQALNPATVRCRITGRVELPFPWRDATIRQFIRAESVSEDSTDDVTFDVELPETARLQSVQIDRRARGALSKLVDEFETLKVIDGTLRVVDVLHPSRNTHRWAESFGEIIQNLRSNAATFAHGGLKLVFEQTESGDETTMNLQPQPDPAHRRCRVSLEADAPPQHDGQLRSRLQRIATKVEKRPAGDDRLQLRGIVDRNDDQLIARLAGVCGGSD